MLHEILYLRLLSLALVNTLHAAFEPHAALERMVRVARQVAVERQPKPVTRVARAFLDTRAELLKGRHRNDIPCARRHLAPALCHPPLLQAEVRCRCVGYEIEERVLVGVQVTA